MKAMTEILQMSSCDKLRSVVFATHLSHCAMIARCDNGGYGGTVFVQCAVYVSIGRKTSEVKFIGYLHRSSDSLQIIGFRARRVRTNSIVLVAQ